MEAVTTGKKCCKNHPDKLVHSKGLCKNCYDKQLKINNPSFKRKQYENHKKWENNNKDRVREYQKKRKLLHKDRDREVRFERSLIVRVS